MKDNQIPSDSDTVLKISPVRNLSGLYRLCKFGMVLSGTICLLFVALLVYNYLVPYHVTGLEAEMERLQQQTPPQATGSSTGETTGFVLDGDETETKQEESASAETLVQPRYSVPFLTLPTEASVYLDRRQKLIADPGNIALQNEVRAVDLLLRNQYFQRRARARSWSFILLAWSGLLILFASSASVINRQLPRVTPQENCGHMTEIRQSQQRTVILTGIIILGGIGIGMTLGLLLNGRPELEQFLAEKAKEYQKNPPVQVAEKTPEAQESETTATKPVATTAASTPPPAPAPVATMAKTPTKAPAAAAPTATAPVTTAGPADVPLEPGPDPANKEAFLAVWNKNWPVFRGPFGSGIVSEKVLEKGAGAESGKMYPDTWDFASGENVIWKTEISLPGHNSPVIWGERLFFIGADENERKVFCYHTKTGKQLWETVVPKTTEGAGELELNPDTGYAAASVVTDGTRVYAIFPNGDLTALDFQGKIVWNKGFGIPKSHYGYSSSLTLWFDRVIIQFDIDADQEETPKDKKPMVSRLVAVKGTDGAVLWETARPDARGSWASPSVSKIGDSWQILVMGDPYLSAYNPEDGKELWRFTGFETDVAPSPISWGTTVYAVHSTPFFAAIDATGRGDLTKTPKTLWTAKCSGLPNACCPLPVPGMVLLLSENGGLTGMDLASKKPVWELFVDEGDSFYSTPVYTGRYVYLFAKTGEEQNAYIVDPDKLQPGTVDSEALDLIEIDGALVKKIPLPEPVCATPALQDGRLFVRGEKTLWCLGKK